MSSLEVCNLALCKYIFALLVEVFISFVISLNYNIFAIKSKQKSSHSWLQVLWYLTLNRTQSLNILRFVFVEKSEILYVLDWLEQLLFLPQRFKTMRNHWRIKWSSHTHTVTVDTYLLTLLKTEFRATCTVLLHSSFCLKTTNFNRNINRSKPVKSFLSKDSLVFIHTCSG